MRLGPLRIDAVAPLGYGGRVALYFATLFSVSGIAMPYLNVWLAHIGLSIGEIAIVAAAAPLVRMVAGTSLAFAADRSGAHRAFLIWLGWGYLVGWLAMLLAGGFVSALAAQVVIAATGAALIPLIETIAVAGVRRNGIDYGRVRLWGSVSFIVANLVSSWLVEWRGIGVVLWLILACAILAAVSGHLAPRSETPLESTRRPIDVRDALRIVKLPTFLLFLIAVGAVQGAHSVLYTFSVLHWRSLGISNTWCGALWAISVVAEIVLFAWAATLMRGWTPVGFMMLGAGAAVVRWIAMGFDPPLAVLVPLQILHAFTYAASHLGAIQFLGRVLPEKLAGTGQGLYALMTGGLAMAVAAPLGGAVYASAGGRAYWVMAAFAVVSVAALAALARTWDGRPLDDAPAREPPVTRERGSDSDR